MYLWKSPDDVPKQIEDQVQRLIDWLVQKDRRE